MMPNATSSHVPVGRSVPSSSTSRKIRTMVVDDSAVIRGLITRMLEAEDDIVVVKSAQNGQAAVQQMARKFARLCEIWDTARAGAQDAA